MMVTARRAPAFALLMGLFFWQGAASAQPISPVPPELRGAWFAGSCTAPDAMLHLTARSAARLPARGPSRLLRFNESREQDGWLIGTGRGAEAPRIMLRPGGTEGLVSAEPGPKLRDDRLPGDTPVQAWHRCPAPPLAMSALHGEGLAMLGALEQLEAACGTPAGQGSGCIATVIAIGDVSGDRLLSVAEIGRLIRGMTWVLAAADGASADALAFAGAGGALAGVAGARLVMESLDYDGDGRISAAELGQDRVALAPSAGDAAGQPLRLEGVQDGIALLRGLMEGLLPGR
ncbi:hypothetical protein ACFOD4_16910 [Pseudoroseomonas globiformis]|uniref:EF-hand domain-containing protein n=1 Tax=Teichococcus globiformis TaxID=2307229 RepID=A0ABV7G961_9PROT